MTSLSMTITQVCHFLTITVMEVLHYMYLWRVTFQEREISPTECGRKCYINGYKTMLLNSEVSRFYLERIFGNHKTSIIPNKWWIVTSDCFALCSLSTILAERHYRDLRLYFVNWWHFPPALENRQVMEPFRCVFAWRLTWNTMELEMTFGMA